MIFTKPHNENPSSETKPCEAGSSSFLSVRGTNFRNLVSPQDSSFGAAWSSSGWILSNENLLLLLSERRVTQQWEITSHWESLLWRHLPHKQQKQMIYWQRDSEWKWYPLIKMGIRPCVLTIWLHIFSFFHFPFFCLSSALSFFLSLLPSIFLSVFPSSFVTLLLSFSFPSFFPYLFFVSFSSALLPSFSLPFLIMGQHWCPGSGAKAASSSVLLVRQHVFAYLFYLSVAVF